MIIHFESELMKNQKHADVMAPDQAFEVLQSADGDSLFFSLGTDGVFYLTREARDTKTGWDRIDLSSRLGAQLQLAGAKAKHFCVAQNAQSGAIDLALAMTDGTRDYLVVSLGHSNTDLSWAAGVDWTYLPFDAAGVSMPVLGIADISILQNVSGEFIVVDILQQPGNALGLISRYVLTPGNPVKWNAHDLPVSLSAGGIVSTLGQRAGDQVASTYTFGSIGGTPEMIVTQLYNPWKKMGPGNQAGFTSRMTVPAGATAMAVATGPDGNSNLFIAGSGALTLFAPDNQDDGAQGLAVVTNPLFAGVQALRAATTNGRTVVWAVNQQGTLFYVACPAGSETEAGAWSTPVPILFDVEGIAPFLNQGADNSVIFAHVDGANLVQLTQNPVTTEWQQRSILLPSTDPDDMLSYDSFTTHLRVTDDNNLPQANVALALTAASPVSVYANDVYHVLSPSVPIQVTTDATGVLTLVQETQALSAVVYRIDAGNGVTATVDPMSKLMGTLNGIGSGDDLGKVQVQDEQGNARPLVPSDVTADQKNAAAETLKQFMQVARGLPADGSKAPAGGAPPAGGGQPAAAAVHPGVAPAKAAFSVRFDGDTWSHSGTLAATGHPAAALAAAPAGDPLGDLGSAIKVEAGDLFRWLKHAFDDVVGFTIKVVDDVAHFFVKLGDQIYHLILDAVSTVVHAVELVFNKIKVFFKDLIAWLGFLFNWPDIVRTHAVLKNLLLVYANEAVRRIQDTENDIKTFVTGLESKIDSWAGLPTDGDTIGATGKSSSKPAGSDSPQANWGLHHFKSNSDQLTTNRQLNGNDGAWGAVRAIIDDLEKMIDNEADAFMDAFKKLKDDVIDVHGDLTPGEIVKRVTAIILDLLLTTAENIVTTALDVIAQLLRGAIDLLDAPIKIPVISAVYREMAGADLSILDLMCLIGAIPVTVIYKVAQDRAPFANDDLTTKMSKAPDFAAFKAALGPNAPRMRAPASAAALTAAPAAGGGSMKLAVAPQGRSLAMARQATPAGSSAGGSDAGDSSTSSALVSDHVGDVLSVVLYAAGSFAADVLVFINMGKKDLEESGNSSSLLNLAGFATYLPYVGPNIPGALGDYDKTWYMILNDVVTLISIGKTGVDAIVSNAKWEKKVSPWLECAINTVWLVPACASLKDSHGTPDALGFVANLFFDFGGCIAPATFKENWKADPETAAIGSAAFFAGSQIMTGLYGFFCLLACLTSKTS